MALCYIINTVIVIIIILMFLKSVGQNLPHWLYVSHHDAYISHHNSLCATAMPMGHQRSLLLSMGFAQKFIVYLLKVN